MLSYSWCFNFTKGNVLALNTTQIFEWVKITIGRLCISVQESINIVCNY